MTVFLTDTLSVLQTLTNNKLPHLAKAMQLLLSNNCRLTLQWIPAHCGVPGNEQKDTLAKQGAQTVQPGDNLRWYRKLHAHLVRIIDRPQSIYSKTVNGMTRKDIQLDKLRR